MNYDTYCKTAFGTHTETLEKFDTLRANINVPTVGEWHKLLTKIETRGMNVKLNKGINITVNVKDSYAYQVGNGATQHRREERMAAFTDTLDKIQELVHKIMLDDSDDESVATIEPVIEQVIAPAVDEPVIAPVAEPEPVVDEP